MNRNIKMLRVCRGAGRILVVLVCLLSIEAQATYRYNYICPAYAGGFFIGDGVIGLQLFDEHPGIGEISGRRHLVLDRFKYTECKEAKFFCISGGGESEFIVDVPIVVPKVIDTKSKYEYSGLTLEAAPVERERFKSRKAVQVVAQSSSKQGGSWYSLTIVEGVGVVDFYISSARATKSATGDPVELKGLTCYLDSEKGIFSKVVISGASSTTIF